MNKSTSKKSQTSPDIADACWQCGCVVPADQDFCLSCRHLGGPTPVRFNHYIVKGYLGSGGFGVVYRCWDSHFQRTVAVKRLKLEDEDDADLVANELAILGSLDDHLNIVKAHYYSEAGHYIVMEYVGGGSLQSAIDTSSESVRNRFIEIATGICDGLQAAHRQRYVHGDVKPANILLTEGGAPKLADFGLARALRSSRPIIGIAGTLPFMAPEVVMGDEWDQRADIYSLGVVFYVMLTGKLPFEATTNHGLMMKIASGEYDGIADAAPDVPPRIARLVSDMIAPVEKRVQSLDKVIHVLNPPEHRRPERIDQFQDELREIYYSKNFNRPPLLLLWHLGTSLAGALGGVAANDPQYARARAHTYFPRLFAWTCAVISALEWRVSEIVWFKYPGSCPYCDHVPCTCAEEGRLRLPQSDVNRQLLAKIRDRGQTPAPSERFAYYQAMFDRIYGETNEKQGLDVLARRAQAEVFGVADALLRIKTLEDLREVDVLHLELADLVAWFFAVVNAYLRRESEYDFVENYATIFHDGTCYRCGGRPCVCPDADEELKMFDWRRLQAA
jgi:serine/threonine protein kinase/NTP pyrophosphatase (non-canonical NTP hydrolase)